ncbi:MAG TPA: hypothetical protein VHZ78_02475 [Rhizomicrobium sp.]|jgi:hypothetical protein|nr:hypothetical protein [Rhizomicrobium sp.]
MKALIIAIAMIVPTVAFASSDEAWSDLARTAKAACTAAIKPPGSNVKTVSLTGTVIGIGGKDNDQFYALVLKAKSPAYSAQVLCLYDKRTQKAQVSDIDAP